MTLHVRKPGIDKPLFQTWAWAHIVTLVFLCFGRGFVELVYRVIRVQAAIWGIKIRVPILKFDPAAWLSASDQTSN